MKKKKFTAIVKKQGNSRVIVIPKDVRKDLGLDWGSEVEVELTKNSEV